MESNPWKKFEESTPRKDSWELFDSKTIENTIEYFNDKLTHTDSEELPFNIFNEDSYAIYNNNLKGYQAESPQENITEVKTDTFDFRKSKGDINIGWKMHLNVNPEHVKTVSEYLKENNIIHKYLSGGEIEDGKIFTLYVGNHEITESCAKKISDEISEFLCKPAASNEIELSRGIVGRFVGNSKDFLQYGPCGYSLLREWLYNDKLCNVSNIKLIGDEKMQNEALNAGKILSFKKLKEEYGTYFF